MINKMIETTCVICKYPRYEVLFRAGRDDVPINFSICKSCGLTYLNPRWTKEAYDAYYASEYDPSYRSDVFGPEYDSVKYETAKQIFLRLKERNKLPEKPINILDVGSGMGWTSEYFKDNVFDSANYYAIEPSLHCVENLKKNNIEVLTTDIDDNWNAQIDFKFDLVIMRHVLEHFMDPVEVLKKISNVLSENGILYLAVPNANNPKLPIRKNFFRVVHTYYFSPPTLVNCLRLSGLKTDNVVEMDQENPYEVYCVCTKNDRIRKPILDSNGYMKTRSFFKERLKEECSIVGKVGPIAIRWGHAFYSKIRAKLQR